MQRFRITLARVIALGLLAALAAVLGLNLTTADSQRSSASGGSQKMAPVADRFAYLASARSNRCALDAAELQRMPSGERLQGSCCFPMDRARYEQQLRGLRAYRRTGVVPQDPYDVAVRLAKRLLGFREIQLSGTERAVYDRAAEISSLGGPCCCPCWRWQAFEGQARFLIARRHFSAARVARLWDLEEGCGGPATT